MAERRWWQLWRGGRQGGREAGQRWRGRGGCQGGRRRPRPPPRSSSFSLPRQSPKPTWRSPSHRPGGELLLFSPLTFSFLGLHSFSLCIFWGRKYDRVAPLQPHPWFSRIVGQISILGPSHGPTDLFPSGMPTLTSTSSIFCPMPKLGNTSTHFEGFIPNL